MGASGSRRRRGSGRARQTQPAVRDKAAEFRHKRRIIRLGQALMAVGALVVVVHLLAHIGAFGAQPPGWQDLAVGYPTGGFLFIAGAIAAGQ